MATRDEWTGCPKCRTVLFWLRAMPGDNHGVFHIKREPMTVTQRENFKTCDTCGEPLVRMHKDSW